MRRFGHPSGGFWKGYKVEKIKYRRTTDKGSIRVSPVFYLDWDIAYKKNVQNATMGYRIH